MPYQLLITATHAKTRQHLLHLRGVGGNSGQSGSKAQVFLDGHGFLEGVEVTQVAEVLKIGFALVMNGRAIPENFAGLDRSQTTHHAQQTGLADAIGTGHIEPTAALQNTVNILEKGAPAPAASKAGERKYWRSVQGVRWRDQSR